MIFVEIKNLINQFDFQILMKHEWEFTDKNIFSKVGNTKCFTEKRCIEKSCRQSFINSIKSTIKNFEKLVSSWEAENGKNKDFSFPFPV